MVLPGRSVHTEAVALMKEAHQSNLAAALEHLALSARVSSEISTSLGTSFASGTTGSTLLPTGNLADRIPSRQAASPDGPVVHPRIVTALQLLEESDDESVFCGPPSEPGDPGGSETRALEAWGIGMPAEDERPPGTEGRPREGGRSDAAAPREGRPREPRRPPTEGREVRAPRELGEAPPRRAQPLVAPRGELGGESQKFICVFQIGLEDDEEFCLVKRILGKAGNNMRRIAEECSAKVRLRGIGSGFLEGADGKEANMPLQLNVSCTDYDSYHGAVERVAALLKDLYKHYRRYARSKGMEPPDVKINLEEVRRDDLNVDLLSQKAQRSPSQRERDRRARDRERHQQRERERERELERERERAPRENTLGGDGGGSSEGPDRANAEVEMPPRPERSPRGRGRGREREREREHNRSPCRHERGTAEGPSPPSQATAASAGLAHAGGSGAAGPEGPGTGGREPREAVPRARAAPLLLPGGLPVPTTPAGRRAAARAGGAAAAAVASAAAREAERLERERLREERERQREREREERERRRREAADRAAVVTSRHGRSGARGKAKAVPPVGSPPTDRPPASSPLPPEAKGKAAPVGAAPSTQGPAPGAKGKGKGTAYPGTAVPLKAPPPPPPGPPPEDAVQVGMPSPSSPKALDKGSTHKHKGSGRRRSGNDY